MARRARPPPPPRPAARLVADDLDAGVHDRLQAGDVHVGHAQVAHRARRLRVRQVQHRVRVVGHPVVAVVVLQQVDGRHAQPTARQLHRLVDGAGAHADHLGGTKQAQLGGHRAHPRAALRIRAQKVPDQQLGVAVVICGVEACHAGVHERAKVGDGRRARGAVGGAVAAVAAGCGRGGAGGGEVR